MNLFRVTFTFRASVGSSVRVFEYHVVAETADEAIERVEMRRHALGNRMFATHEYETSTYLVPDGIARTA